MKENNAAKGKNMKRGAYIAAMGAIVIVIAIVINLIIAKLPSSATEIDLTSSKVYSITDLTKETLAAVEDDVDIIVFAAEANTDERIFKLINNVAAASSKVHVTAIDPEKNPSALEKYNASADTVLVIDNDSGKSTTIAMTGFAGYGNAMILYDYQTYSYYGTLSATSFDAEGQLLRAINYVTSDNSSMIYYMQGHGEADLGTNASGLIGKLNATTGSVNLLKDGGVPEDCDLLIINTPTADLADDEKTMLEDYLKSGGKVTLIIGESALANFNGLMAEYGLEMQEGYIGDESLYYSSYASYYGYYCIAPNISASSDITADITADAMLLYARGLKEITPTRTGSTADAFLTTSDSGFAYVDENNMTQGAYILGATACETVDEDSGLQSRLTVITAPYLIDDSLTSSITSLSNLDIFINAVKANLEGASETATIPEVSLAITYNSFTNTTLWSVLFLAVIPLAFLVCGFVTWNRRRKN